MQKDIKNIVRQGKNYYIKSANQRGQVLLFVIVSLTLAMAIGVAAATRTLASLSRTSRSDTSNKVLAAAESGAEHFLSMSTADLSDAASDFADSGDPAILPFSDEVSGVDTQAEVTVTEFSTNSPDGSSYDFNLGTGFVKEITFKGSSFSGTMKFCWDNSESAIYYSVYDANGVTSKGIVADNAGLDTNSIEIEATGCKNLSISPDTYGVRLRSLYKDSNVSVSSSDTLPAQGFKIVSVGTLFQEGKAVTTKKVTVYKSKSYASAVFDIAVYTEENFN